jgi:hypothetical protein
LSSTALSIPKGPWTDLARRLVESKNVADAVTATREVLARGGVATFDGDRNVVQAIGPRARFSATPAETVHLAWEARRRRSAGTMTAAEFAQMLKTFGWPFKNVRAGQDDASAPLRGRLGEDLQQAIREARADDRRAGTSDATGDEREALRQKTMARDAELIK